MAWTRTIEITFILHLIQSVHRAREALFPTDRLERIAECIQSPLYGVISDNVRSRLLRHGDDDVYFVPDDVIRSVSENRFQEC